MNGHAMTTPTARDGHVYRSVPHPAPLRMIRPPARECGIAAGACVCGFVWVAQPRLFGAVLVLVLPLPAPLLVPGVTSNVKALLHTLYSAEGFNSHLSRCKAPAFSRQRQHAVQCDSARTFRRSTVPHFVPSLRHCYVCKASPRWPTWRVCPAYVLDSRQDPSPILHPAARQFLGWDVTNVTSAPNTFLNTPGLAACTKRVIADGRSWTSNRVTAHLVLGWERLTVVCSTTSAALPPASTAASTPTKAMATTRPRPLVTTTTTLAATPTAEGDDASEACMGTVPTSLPVYRYVIEGLFNTLFHLMYCSRCEPL